MLGQRMKSETGCLKISDTSQRCSFSLSQRITVGGEDKGGCETLDGVNKVRCGLLSILDIGEESKLKRTLKQSQTVDN